MNFASDNVAGIAPEILDALANAGHGPVMPYGNDPVTRRAEARLKEIFETDLAMFPVATGTAANSLALSVLTPPYGAVYGHAEGHIGVDECGAPEFFTGGAKLVPLPGAGGKLDAADLDRVLAKAGAGVVHHVQPAVVSLSQATESGTIYRTTELAAIAEVARRHKLAVHMDGARFANALVTLGCSPAEATWKAGVDVLCLGATKNGALAAEAVIFFDPARAADFVYRRKRGGHLFSKMRFLSAQLDAYLKDDLWLRLARHANAMAQRLAEGLAGLPGVRLRDPVEANELFVEMPGPVIDGLLAAGFVFYRWEGDLIRLVTAFDTAPASVDAFLAETRRLLPAAQPA